MHCIFVDTNVFMRFLLWDVPSQSEEAEMLFQKAAALKTKLVTTDLIIAELVWTLESYYQKSKKEIASLIGAILETPGLTINSADVIQDALASYVEKNVDFVVAFSAAYMNKHGISIAKSFDKHFKRFPDIELV